MAFLGLLSSRHVQKHAEHDPPLDIGVVALAAGRNPPDVVTDDDPEIDLVGADDRARRGEGGANPVAVGRMDLGRQALEDDERPERQVPQVIAALVHGELVGVDVPRPQGHPGRLNREP